MVGRGEETSLVGAGEERVRGPSEERGGDERLGGVWGSRCGGFWWVGFGSQKVCGIGWWKVQMRRALWLRTKHSKHITSLGITF